MPFFPKTKQELVQQGLQDLLANTNITQLSPGGKARFFIEVTSKEQAKQHALFDQNLLQSYIQYAKDRFLDFFGDMFGLPRLEATHAESTDNNFMFYVQSGTFGDINNGASFTIPAGQTITTTSFQGNIITPGLTSQPVITYSTTEEAICNADSSFVYVSIRANVEGKNSSIPKNVLTTHSFTNYSLSSSNLLKCTNRFAIDNGDEREADGAYRYRLLQVFRAKEKAIKAAIRLAALSVPGVSDVKIVNGEQGPGTYSLYILSMTPTVSQELIQNITASCAVVSAEGVRPYILAPKNIGFEFVASVNWNPKTSTEQRAKEYGYMREALENFFNGTEIGDSIDLVDVISELLNSAPSALSIGKAVPNKFEEVYVYRSSPDGTGSTRSKLLTETVSLLYNERAILETSGINRGILFK
jgi:uncharacterized phage protein gp47/JayE